MKGRLAAGCLGLALVLVPAAYGRIVPQANERFVAEAFDSAGQRLFETLTLPETLSLRLHCGDSTHAFFENILTARLQPAVSDLYLDQSSEGRACLDVHLYRAQFVYTREGGGLLSKGRLYRNFDVSLFATLKDAHGRVQWQNQVAQNFRERIDWDSADRENAARSGIFGAPLPATDRLRLWEPLIVGGLLGGFVYLFFASR